MQPQPVCLICSQHDLAHHITTAQVFPINIGPNSLLTYADTIPLLPIELHLFPPRWIWPLNWRFSGNKWNFVKQTNKKPKQIPPHLHCILKQNKGSTDPLLGQKFVTPLSWVIHENTHNGYLFQQHSFLFTTDYSPKSVLIIYTMKCGPIMSHLFEKASNNKLPCIYTQLQKSLDSREI